MSHLLTCRGGRTGGRTDDQNYQNFSHEMVAPMVIRCALARELRFCFCFVTLCFVLSTKTDLRGSLLKGGPLDFATKIVFLYFFVGEKALVGIY